MSTSDGMEQGVVTSAAALGMRPVPLLHNSPLELASPGQLRKRLHDLSNALTGLLGNLELAGMAAEDGELDLESINIALASAREAMGAIRELKQQFDLGFPLDAAAS